MCVFYAYSLGGYNFRFILLVHFLFSLGLYWIFLDFIIHFFFFFKLLFFPNVHHFLDLSKAIVKLALSTQFKYFLSIHVFLSMNNVFSYEKRQAL